MKPGLAIVLAAAWLLCGCHGLRNPYLSSRDTRGTPSDRTGGAGNTPVVRGGGPMQDLAPGPGHNNNKPPG
jgi:hypothetical protein